MQVFSIIRNLKTRKLLKQTKITVKLSPEYPTQPSVREEKT